MAPQCHCCAAANVAIGTFNMHWIRRRHSTMHYNMHRHRHIGMPEHERIIDWHRAIVWCNAIQLVPSHTFVFMCVAETIPIDPRVLRINPGTAHNVIPLPKWITQPTSTRASYVHTIACDDASGKLLRTNRTHTQWHTASSSIRAPGMKVAVKFVFELGMGDFSGREEGARWFLFLVTHYSGPKVSILPNIYVLRSLWMVSERKKEMQTMNIWGPDEKRFLCLSLISTNDKQCYTLCVLDDWTILLYMNIVRMCDGFGARVDMEEVKLLPAASFLVFGGAIFAPARGLRPSNAGSSSLLFGGWLACRQWYSLDKRGRRTFAGPTLGYWWAGSYFIICNVLTALNHRTGTTLCAC